MKSISIINLAITEGTKWSIVKVRPVIDQKVLVHHLMPCIAMLCFQLLQTLWVPFQATNSTPANTVLHLH